MTKLSPIKTSEIDEFAQLDLHQLESKIKQLQENPPSREIKSSLRAARQALRQRQRHIKAQAMEFEQTNDHHLLLFDSTDNFSKIGGHSVLYYTLTIADRIHRSYSIKNDSDDYSRSEDGIISIRALNQLGFQLAEINILNYIFINYLAPTATNKLPNCVIVPAKMWNALLLSLYLSHPYPSSTLPS